jgi:plastocyanin
MKRKYFLIPLALVITAASIFYSCSKNSSYSTPGGGTPPPGGGTPPGGNTTTITMDNMMFSPKVDTVTMGSVVTWSNTDGITHTATSDDGTTFSSGNVAGGSNFKFTAATAGTFTYHCIYHQSMGMVGTLVVKP